MRATTLRLLIGAMLLTLVGCESVDSRIANHETTFARLGPVVQERLREGEVKVGDSYDMVTIAIGAPQHRDDITISNGATRSTWTYTKKVRQPEGSRNVRYDRRTGQVSYEEVFRVDELVMKEVIFVDGRVTRIIDPFYQNPTLAAISRR